MRELLEAAERRLLEAEGANATNATVEEAVPLATPLVGSSYSCVSRNEYRAMAMDARLSKESR